MDKLFLFFLLSLSMTASASIYMLVEGRVLKKSKDLLVLTIPRGKVSMKISQIRSKAELEKIKKVQSGELLSLQVPLKTELQFQEKRLVR